MTDNSRIRDGMTVEQQRDEWRALYIEACDMLTDASIFRDAMREALGLSQEPHQTTNERMLEAARSAPATQCIPTDRADSGMVDALMEDTDRLRQKNARLADALKRLRAWDMMDASGDGTYWRKEIDEALSWVPPEVQARHSQEPAQPLIGDGAIKGNGEKFEI